MLKSLNAIVFAVAASLIAPNQGTACDGAKSDQLVQPENAQPELLMAMEDDDSDDGDDDDDDGDDD
jgi:hypothetical protein